MSGYEACFSVIGCIIFASVSVPACGIVTGLRAVQPFVGFEV